MDETGIFRKKSLERINSPGQLNEYVRVTNPGVWIMLAAIISLIIGALIWSVFFTFKTYVSCAVRTTGGASVCYIKAEDAEKIAPGMEIEVDSKFGTIEKAETEPIRLDGKDDEYLLYILGGDSGDFFYAVPIDGYTPSEDGVCTARITTESVHPISFLIN